MGGGAPKWEAAPLSPKVRQKQTAIEYTMLMLTGIIWGKSGLCVGAGSVINRGALFIHSVTIYGAPVTSKTSL